jgi:hypothetical protein
MTWWNQQHLILSDVQQDATIYIISSQIKKNTYMIFKAFMVKEIHNVVFWVMTPRNLEGGLPMSEEHSVSTLTSKGGSRMSL